MDKEQMNEEFTCVACGRTYIATRSKEEALKEAFEEYPGFTEEQMVTICDDCYVPYYEWYVREGKFLLEHKTPDR